MLADAAAEVLEVEFTAEAQVAEAAAAETHVAEAEVAAAEHDEMSHMNVPVLHEGVLQVQLQP